MQRGGSYRQCAELAACKWSTACISLLLRSLYEVSGWVPAGNALYTTVVPEDAVEGGMRSLVDKEFLGKASIVGGAPPLSFLSAVAA